MAVLSQWLDFVGSRNPPLRNQWLGWIHVLGIQRYVETRDSPTCAMFCGTKPPNPPGLTKKHGLWARTRAPVARIERLLLLVSAIHLKGSTSWVEGGEWGLGGWGGGGAKIGVPNDFLAGRIDTLISAGGSMMFTFPPPKRVEKCYSIS